MLIIVLKRGILIKIIQVIGRIDRQHTCRIECIIIGLSTLTARGLVETTLPYVHMEPYITPV